MMGERQVEQDALFYEFSLERHVPAEDLLRSIRFVELDEVRPELAPFYSELGRPSIDPELMIRMLIVGYCFGIRSERRWLRRGSLEPCLPLVSLGGHGCQLRFFSWRRLYCVGAPGRVQASLRAQCLTAPADRMG
jgi:hypothetical protein